MTDQLEAALARSAGRITPSPAPVLEILHAGRARRAGRRALMATAACAVGAVLALGWAVKPLVDHGAAPAGQQSAGAGVSRTVGQGVLDGRSWSVTLTYYPTEPADYPTGPAHRGLVCLKTVVAGTPTDPYGNCAGVAGPTATGPAGLYGDQTLPDGGTLFIAQPKAAVASATMTFTDGRTTTAKTVTLPGTAFTAYVVPVPAALHMSSLDEYDAQHHAVGHQAL
ncbi:hypothetical protein GCM10009760_28770 [Kitasatospora kazusensis]|uniref:Uncharacterized protein n=1 Tax=Kitasatospora kazusensis TaxID=407974 RepID=A0ABN2ZJ49_9ACTN